MSTSFQRDGLLRDGLLRNAAPATHYAASKTVAARPACCRSKPEQGAVRLKSLLANRLLSSLPDDELAALIPHLEPVNLRYGENLYEVGEQAEAIFFPEDSVLSCLSILEDGSAPEVAIIGKDGAVGLNALFGCASSVQFTQVSIGGTALRVNAKIVRREFDTVAALSRALLGYTNHYINQVSQRAICGIRHQVKDRLVNWLLAMHDRTDTDELPFTHDFIAQRLGSRRSGITVAARELQDEQLIGYTRGRIRILDRRRLEAAACECYATLASTHDTRCHP